MTQSLSPSDARKLVLQCQGLPPAKQSGPAVAATLDAIERLGYVQVDTISVVQRAHHHTLWCRNPRYRTTHLDTLIEQKQVFEYWSHAAAYLPMRDYRFSLPKKQAMARGEQSHWFKRDKKLMRQVMQRIAQEGPLMAKDFEHKGRKVGDWDSKPAKRALENLYMQGDLMAARRVNFHKVYDLTERVLPEGTDTSVPAPEEVARFQVTRFLSANGLGDAAQMTYLKQGSKALVQDALQAMLENGEIVSVKVLDKDYVALPAALQALSRPLARSKLKILSPFDNLVIQRKRLQALFGFDYWIECYVPAAKRKHGYFVLPILWDGKLVARMDCRADRKRSVLDILQFTAEPGLRKTEAFCAAFGRELEAFLRFNDCSTARLHRVEPAALKPALEAEITHLAESQA